MSTLPFHSKRIAVLAFVAVLPSACATHPGNYWSTYQVNGSEELDAAKLQQAQAQLIEERTRSLVGVKIDRPIALIKYVPPVMSREDIDAGVAGEVVVLIRFDERGLVQNASITKSTKDSLAASVRAAVGSWQIAPVTHDGKPTAVSVAQTFRFGVAGTR